MNVDMKIEMKASEQPWSEGRAHTIKVWLVQEKKESQWGCNVGEAAIRKDRQGQPRCCCVMCSKEYDFSSIFSKRIWDAFKQKTDIIYGLNLWEI